MGKIQTKDGEEMKYKYNEIYIEKEKALKAIDHNCNCSICKLNKERINQLPMYITHCAIKIINKEKKDE